MNSPVLSDALEALPLIAILRGIHPQEAIAVSHVLVEAGFRIIEVPLNSPEPLRSIEMIQQAFGHTVIVGAGTVLNEAQAQEVVDAGGQLLIAPNLNHGVATVARASSVAWCPGVFTVSEAFQALDAGAAALKIFPAEAMPPTGVKAMRAVLPPQCRILPVGSINPDNMTLYWQAGANGFGLGGALYRPGDSAEKVAGAAQNFVRAINKIRAN